MQIKIMKSEQKKIARKYGARVLAVVLMTVVGTCIYAADNFVSFTASDESELLISRGGTVGISVAEEEYAGVKRAINSLCRDLNEVVSCDCSTMLRIRPSIVIGTLGKSDQIKSLIKSKKLDEKLLKGKTEKYIITMIDHQMVIAGSDKRGTIYGIYEFARQIGISPWHWWADVPAEKHSEIYIKKGIYTDGEPVVRYRGIFLNDEAPCLSGWVKEKFPDSECPTANPKLAKGFNSNFYEKVFELLLRLKGNYLWPAMWGNAFYADDTRNSELADEMGIMMGTSHHEPMARNHQEWARNRQGAWDYESNQEVIDKFFREGIRRAKSNEDLITIGMRGDGDTGLGGKEGHDDEYVNQDEKNIKLMEKIFRNQRQIIKEETGKPAEKRQQVWALYKEVQRLYDLGLRVPDDVLILLCDDNWGNIRKVPTTQHKGGWGMYYHVDYVGAPRCTKWANVTPIAHMWEQLSLTYQYGIDRLWILNVGDLKPMEYPIDFFLKMAWDPKKYTAETFRDHTYAFCEEAFGRKEAKKAQEILETYLQYNGRVTPEMLSAKTYNLTSGEFKEVVNEYKALEAEALRQYMTLAEEAKNAYFQLILYPVQSMANLYEMYYAQALNQYLYDRGDEEANEWADRTKACFERDSILTDEYHKLNNGKWNHLMDQTHIGYKIWQQPDKNIMPGVNYVTEKKEGGYSFSSQAGYIAIEAKHYNKVINSSGSKWTNIETYGRTKSGMALMPYTAATENAAITYKIMLPSDVESVKLHVVTNSTLAFARPEGHRYSVQIDDMEPVVVNYNGRYNEDNQWEMYDIVATRVIETVTPLNVMKGKKEHIVTIRPIEPGMVLEKIIVDYGGYSRSHLFGTESTINK